MDSNLKICPDKLILLAGKLLCLFKQEFGESLDLENDLLWVVDASDLVLNPGANTPKLGLASVSELLETAQSCGATDPVIGYGLHHLGVIFSLLGRHSLLHQFDGKGEDRPSPNGG